ncbi:Shugoshin [Golovinomyces cichoracearum]|uniref:Shugoshin n=1 Tax=Golovinomyces cichoracearum TaxID=62708 RepID=A0A420J7H8_9PEZI|nr:Shugoshin [Golovinomyces cichoracearum]
MARLNEPGASPETLESLKRKFIRQNRDLARVNSTQSLRIGELENEISKLLSENLSLRGQILRLQSDQENQKARRIGEQTFRLKALLESKLIEISALVGDLGQEAQQHKIPPKRRKNRCSSSIQSPKENWENFYSEKEAVISPDGRLPPIMEDPSHLRRNSENQDSYNRAFTAEIFSVESPEIGSPPKLQFVDADPVKIEIPTNTNNRSIDEPISLDPTLSITVEQRRKKKDSLGSADVKRQNLATTTSENKEIIGTLRSGAKRKLSVREEEERAVEVNGDKKEATNRERKSKSTADVKPITTVDEQERDVKNETENQIIKNPKSSSSCTRGSREKQNLTERKALAPKNVNASPRKRNNLIGDAKKLSGNITPKVARSKEKNGENIQHIAVFREPSAEVILETTEFPDETYSQVKLQIPAAPNKSSTDVLTVLSASPVVNKLEVSPHPLDIVPPSGDSSRPSRRVRGSVSYAEPNLRHKMRRPTKKLADAIIRDEFNSSGRQPVNLNEVTEGSIVTPNSKTCSVQNGRKSPPTLEKLNSKTISGKDDSSSTAHKNISLAKEEKDNLTSEPTPLTTAQSKSKQASAKTKNEQLRLESKSLDCSGGKNENTDKDYGTESDTSSLLSPFSKTKVKDNQIDSNCDSIGPSTNSAHKKSSEIVSRRRRRSTLAIRSASTMATESNREIDLNVSSRHNIIV